MSVTGLRSSVKAIAPAAGTWVAMAPRITAVSSERDCTRLAKAGVPAAFVRINGAGHGFEGAVTADLERVSVATVRWFKQHLGRTVKRP